MILSRRSYQLAATLLWVAMLALFFAQTEIQIEGAAGWAANLPTWRFEHHWLLDLFWGGRPMTGYHAWMFPFISLFFHFPVFLNGIWSWQLECRILACIMFFWLLEDFLWFALNPAYGLERFQPAAIPWHKHWLLALPVDYWILTMLCIGLLWLSGRQGKSR